MSADAIGLEFDRVAPYLRGALEYTGNTHTLEDIRRGVADGSLQLWPANKSAIVTELVLYPTGVKVVNFVLAGGTLEEVRQLHHIVLGWARSQGCQRAVCTGRKGWERTFLTREAGWKPALVHYTKEL